MANEAAQGITDALLAQHLLQKLSGHRVTEPQAVFRGAADAQRGTAGDFDAMSVLF
jgi:hypothetical protein